MPLSLPKVELTPTEKEPFSLGDVSQSPSRARASQETRTRRKRRRNTLPLEVVGRGLMPTESAKRLALTLSSLRFPSLEQIQKLVRSDPGIALSTFRYASKEHADRADQFSGIEQVVAILGMEGMKTVLGTMADMNTLDEFSPHAAGICDHSVRVAALSAFIAETFCESDKEQAYLTGLLHDVGKLLIVQARELDYGAVPERFDQPNLLNIYERQTLGYDHSKFGWHALSSWGLPEPIPTVVAWHHQGSRAYQVGGTIAHLVAIVRTADMLERALVDPTLDDDALYWHLDKNLACRQLELTPALIRQHWPALKRIRKEALLSAPAPVV